MSRAKVVLYHPRGESLNLPLPLLHLASMLPEFDVRIVDGRIDLTPESSLAELAEGAVCLGVTVLTGRPTMDALRASRAVKRRQPTLPVIWGGWHPSMLPGQCLASPAVDACVRGQGEETFREVVLRLAAGQELAEVSGVSYKRRSDVVANPGRAFRDVNSLRSVDFEIVDVERYFAFRGSRRLDYASSQTDPMAPGAPASSGVEGKGWSGLEAARVADEIAGHKDRFRLERFAFSDADFFRDLGRAEEIARGLMERQVGLPWSGFGRAGLIRRLTPEQLGLLRQSGCCKVTVETALHGLQEADVGRPSATAEEVVETGEKLNRAGIGARFSFTAGAPGEPGSSLAGTYRTVKALRKINPRFETPIYFCAPYPGTELAKRLSELGLAPPARLEDWENMDLDHSIGPWISEPVRKFVPRYNFYFYHAFEPRPRGVGKRVARWFARQRVRYDFYRFDFERRLVDLSRRLRTGLPARTQPRAAED